ncbi:MAG TPA: hypothetical protein PLG17_02490 [Thermodesulfobacteriota bacterium]|nr:hypothetical protein [Deltaproteobacteria bacterium]HQO77362.1 hypothetical protein [Thermodesulfobacteriota bacterium]
MNVYSIIELLLLLITLFMVLKVQGPTQVWLSLLCLLVILLLERIQYRRRKEAEAEKRLAGFSMSKLRRRIEAERPDIRLGIKSEED